MRAFEVYLNGGRLCVAGLGSGMLMATLCDFRGKEIHFRIAGLLDGTEEHLRWTFRHLNVGDEVRITIVAADSVDEPVTRERHDPQKQLEMEQELTRLRAEQWGWKIQTKP